LHNPIRGDGERGLKERRGVTPFALVYDIPQKRCSVGAGDDLPHSALFHVKELAYSFITVSVDVAADDANLFLRQAEFVQLFNGLVESSALYIKA
jgi:hypothetical protein